MRPFHRSLTGFLLSVLLLFLWSSPPIRSQIPLSPACWMQVGEIQEWGSHLPDFLKPWLSLQIEPPAQSVFSNDVPGVVAIDSENPLKIQALETGLTRISLMLWETIPLQTVEIETTEPRMLVPGGHSIGVKLHSDGVMVVGFAAIRTEAGKEVCPAGEMGLEIGDRIMTVNGRRLSCEEELADMIDESRNQPLQLELLREEEKISLALEPVYCTESERYRIGLYVRDEIAGIGTLSFWDPRSHQYAALGHVILDADTHKAIEVGSGQVVSAPVRLIEPGRPGEPGEKVGVFEEGGMVDGSIEKNNLCGIYGINENHITNPLAEEPLQAAASREIHPGKAEIFTVIEGDTIERFDIEIIRLYPGRENGKNMLLRITDPRLLQATGGIIQGMSGSPILQDGKIIGAVTHALVNDPTRGYGIFIENMLRAAE